MFYEHVSSKCSMNMYRLLPFTDTARGDPSNRQKTANNTTSYKIMQLILRGLSHREAMFYEHLLSKCSTNMIGCPIFMWRAAAAPAIGIVRRPVRHRVAKGPGPLSHREAKGLCPVSHREAKSAGRLSHREALPPGAPNSASTCEKRTLHSTRC